jgi:hypothetical protein
MRFPPPSPRLKTLICQTEVPLTKDLLEQLYPTECKRYIQIENATKSLKAFVSSHLDLPQNTTQEHDNGSDAEDLRYFTSYKPMEDSPEAAGQLSERCEEALQHSSRDAKEPEDEKEKEKDQKGENGVGNGGKGVGGRTTRVYRAES